MHLRRSLVVSESPKPGRISFQPDWPVRDGFVERSASPARHGNLCTSRWRAEESRAFRSSGEASVQKTRTRREKRTPKRQSSVASLTSKLGPAMRCVSGMISFSLLKEVEGCSVRTGGPQSTVSTGRVALGWYRIFTHHFRCSSLSLMTQSLLRWSLLSSKLLMQTTSTSHALLRSISLPAAVVPGHHPSQRARSSAPVLPDQHLHTPRLCLFVAELRSLQLGRPDLDGENAEDEKGTCRSWPSSIRTSSRVRGTARCDRRMEDPTRRPSGPSKLLR